MENKLPKIVLGEIFRSCLTALFTFWATKQAIGHDIAQRLVHGDTVQLWNGSVPLSLSLITSVLVGVALPIVLPLFLGIWSRIVEAYKLVVARCESFALTRTELNQRVEAASPIEIIKTVATQSTKPTS